MIDQNTLNKIKMWENYSQLESDLKNELNGMLDNEALLLDAFYTDIAFGTGGLRGILGVGTNRMNIYVIRKSTKGFLDYMIKKYPNLKEMGVVISYDCRHNSYRFAKEAAAVIASQGVKVYLFSSLRATPELSFGVRYLHAAGGIMITASHNPPIYNGYKVYDHEGCQLVPALADEVIKEISNIKDLFNVETGNFNDLLEEGLIEFIDKTVDEAYLTCVKTVKVQDVDKKNIKIIYTPLHGTGSTHMVNLLTNEGYNIIPVKEQMIPDPNFSTLKSPNPEEPSAFEYAIKLGQKEKADILIATDPDADRTGIAAIDPSTNQYVLLTGNQTGAILLDYLGKFKKPTKVGVVYNTIVTSNLSKAICEKYGLKLVQTLTGFKFIGEQAALIDHTKEEFYFGYEESYGYVIKDFVRDKDSFQATLLLSEVASYYKSIGKTLIEVLEDIYKEYGYYLEGVHNIALAGVEGTKRIEKIMRTFEQTSLTSLGGKKIVTIEDYEEGLRYENGHTTKLTLPKSFVLKYIFDDGGWFVLRPSGTEPKLKIYIAIKGKTRQEAENFIKTLKSEILEMIAKI